MRLQFLDLKALTTRPTVRQVAVAALAAVCGSALIWAVFLRRGSPGEARFALQGEEVIIDLSKSKPDFNKYHYRLSLSSSDLGLSDPSRRLIVVGDIHGSLSSFHSLLNKLSYNPERDTLFHLGDILAKGEDSLGVVQWMAERGVKGVRGNHDQKVVAWRAWMDWVEGVPGGHKWLSKVLTLSSKQYTTVLSLSTLHKAKTKSHSTTKFLSTHHLTQSDLPLFVQLSPPDDWEWSSEHFHIARELRAEQAQYLEGLPLLAHVRDMEAYFVHAGLLPKMRSEEKPDAWTMLNMRSVLKGGAPSRKWDGTKWVELWDSWASSISTSNSPSDDDYEGPPPTVIYGHAASAGLVLTEHTVGIDTGCVYGRRLTSVVIEGGESSLAPPHEEDIEGWVRVGRRWGRLVSVECGKGKA